MSVAYWLKPLKLHELLNLSLEEKIFYQAVMLWKEEQKFKEIQGFLGK
jgi:hypothetical protein